MRRTLRRGRAAALATVLVAAGAPVLSIASAPPAAALSNGVVISQVYGGGGNSGATYTNDFVELFNRGTTSVSLAGWSVQYASATGTGNFGANPVTALSGTLQPGQYYLVQLAGGLNGAALPTPDATGTANASGTAGKFIVANVSTGLACNGSVGQPCNAAQLAQIVDLVGYGSANFFETAPTGTLSNTTAALRKAGGCTETDNNSTDFEVVAPTPRNTASTFNPCTVTPAGVTITQSGGSTDVAEGGATDSYTIVLNSQPTATVTVTVTPDAEVTVSPAVPLEFTTSNWNVPQTVTVAAVDDGDVEGAHTGTITHAAASSDAGYNAISIPNVTANITDNDVAITITKIHEIQGSGAASPLLGQTVTLEGIVVGDFQAQGGGQLRGFFVQEEDADVDANPATSEGLFVFCSTCPTAVNVGDKVAVTGAVSEFFNATQVTASVAGSVVVQSSGNPLPTPATATLPVPTTTTRNAYYEARESMLVTFPDTLSLAEYFELGRYGQVILSSGGRPRQFTDANLPSTAGYATHVADVARRTIILDDTDNVQNSAITGTDKPYFWPRPGLSASNPLRGGDTITGLTGVLHWSFAGQTGTDAWRVRPVEPAFSYAFTSANPRPPTPSVPGDLRVAAYNVLNYFLQIDTTSSNSSGPCGPLATLDCRGPDSVAERDRQQAKLTQALLALDADAFGLMELENSTGVDPLGEIVADLNAATAPGTYASINTGTIGGDAIKVGIVYKPAELTPVGAYQTLDSADDPRFDSNRSRPSLAQTFDATANGARFTLVVNHLKSKGCGEATGADLDQNDGQGCWNATRTSAAEALADWIATDPTGSGDPDFLVVGDMNSYRNEDPITALEAAGFVDLIDTVLGAGAYSYLFSGQLGYLDHALATANLASQVTGVDEWHINADESDLLDYNDTVADSPGESSFERRSAALPLYTETAFRTSDHDPVIVGLSPTKAATTTTLTSSANPSIVGAPVTFTAAVSGAFATPTGTVQFKVNGVDQGAPVPLVAGSASITFAPALGAQVVTAVYSGSATYATSTGTLTQTVTYRVVIGSPTHLVTNTGATIPVRFTLTDAAGVPISDAAARALLSPSCKVTVSASGAQTLSSTCARYDAAADQFLVNWKTDKDGGTGPATITISVTAGSPAGTVTTHLTVTLV